MPLARYFLLVGGALLVVLLVAGACLPSLPVVEQVETQRTKIRIQTEMKLPERVVFDTRSRRRKSRELSASRNTSPVPSGRKR